MAWINNKHETLSSTSDTMDATSMTASEFGMFLNHALPSGGDTQTNYSVNGVDSGGKYAFRTQKNQGSATTSDDQDNVTYDVGGETYDKLSITFACDIADEEKLFIGFGMSRKEAGAGNAPTRANINWKYETTSARVTSVRDDTSSQSGTYEVGSNLSVIGDGGVTQTEKEKLTNVPVGTRFEETDTRKIFRRANLNLNSKLKVYWKFDATTGNYVNKASTVGSPDGITADMTTVSATRTNTGILGKAVDFNGSSEYALANGSASDWSFLFNEKMSVSFWLNNQMGATSGGHTLFSTSTAEGGGGFYMDVTGSSGMRVIWQGSSFSNEAYALTSIVDSSTGWHHFVVTYDSGTTTVYKDGSSFGSSTSYSNHQGYGSDTQNVMIVGCNHTNSGGRDYYTEFMIDEMAFWGDRALTSNEVVDLYNSGSALAITSTTPSDPPFYEWTERGVA